MAGITGKQLVLQAFNLQETERVPAVIFGGGMWIMRDSGNTFEGLIGKPEAMAEMVIRANEKIQSDMVFVGSGYNNVHARCLGGKIKFRPVGAPDLEEPIVNGPEDLERLDLDRLRDDEVINTIWRATELVHRAVGEEVLVTATAWGPFSLAAQLYGVERLMHSIFKNRGMVTACLEFATEMLLKFYEPMIKGGYLGAVSLADATASGDLISRKQFAEFAVPYLRKFTDRVKEWGGTTFLHICGDTNNRLDLFPETGAACIALDSKVDLALAKATIGGRMCVAGNVNPVVVLERGTPGQVEEAAAECIHKAGRGGGFVLLPGCDIPPTVPLENIRAFIGTTRKVRPAN